MRRALSEKTRRPASRVSSLSEMTNTATAQGVDGSPYEQRDPTKLLVSMVPKSAERALKLFRSRMCNLTGV